MREAGWVRKHNTWKSALFQERGKSSIFLCPPSHTYTHPFLFTEICVRKPEKNTLLLHPQREREREREREWERGWWEAIKLWKSALLLDRGIYSSFMCPPSHPVNLQRNLYVKTYKMLSFFTYRERKRERERKRNAQEVLYKDKQNIKCCITSWNLQRDHLI